MIRFFQIKLAVRNLRKHPLGSVINILGLTIGLTAGFLLLTYVRHEMSYDRHFRDSGRIYRLVSGGVMGGNDNVFIGGRCMREAFTEIPAKIPDIEQATQVYAYGNPTLFYEKEQYRSGQRLYVDSTFFEIFQINTLEGNIDKTLQSRDQLIMTRSLAETIFTGETAVGQSITVNEDSYFVGAVVEDIPENSHIQAEIFQPMKALPFLEQLGALEFFTYYKFVESADAGATIEKINILNTEIISRKFSSFGATGVSDVEALTDLHLKTQIPHDLTSKGSMKNVLFISAVCLLILLMAGSNYVSLNVLQGEERAREVGVQKVNGALSSGLRMQFLWEAFVTAGIALLAAILLGRYLLLEPFEELMNREFNMSFSGVGLSILMMAAIGLLTALLSGAYPALVLSAIKPLKVLKGSSEGVLRRNRLSRVMVIVQFAISIFLLGMLALFLKQVHYVKNTSLGFNKEQVAVAYGFDQEVRSHYKTVQEELLQHPCITQVGGSQGYPGTGKSGQVIHKYGEDATNSVELAEERVQPGYFETYQIPLVEGRYFEAGRESDRQAIILNEKAVERLGLTEPVVGSRVVMFDDAMEVIGVVRDFHYRSMRMSIGSLGFTYYSGYWSSLGFRCKPGTRREALEHVEKTLQNYDADYTLKVRWIDDLYDSMYREEKRMNSLMICGSILAVIISVMGLFALAGYIVKRRKKEIGIRKVMGSNPQQINRMIQRSVLLWLSVSAVLAVPVIYLVGQRWLQSFAYHTDFSWWIFLLAGCLALMTAAVTTSFYSVRAANSDPVKTLRYE